MKEIKQELATCTLEVYHKMSDNWVECHGELTKELDTLAGFSSNEDNLFKHYVLIDKLSSIDKQYAIRVPGGTVGYVKVDDNYIIRMIHVDLDYVVKTYPHNVNETIQKYVGQLLKLPH